MSASPPLVCEAVPVSLRPLLPGVGCWACLDTNIVYTSHGIRACSACQHARETRNEAAGKLARCVWERLAAKREIDPVMLQIARVLTRFTTRAPVSREMLECHFRLNKRTVLKIVEGLRKDWLFPVGSRRSGPSGLWVIVSAEDFLRWHHRFRRQPLTELTTAYRLMRANFPELAGQSEFDYADHFSEDSEVKETL